MTAFTIIPASKNALPKAPHQGLHFVNGAFQPSADGQTFDRVSPSHGVVVSRSALGGEVETLAAIKAARDAFDSRIWNDLSGKARASYLL